MDDDEFERRVQSRRGRRRKDVVAELTNAELRYYHHQLHNPAIIDRTWLPLIEAEMRRRGMIRES